MRQVTVLLMAIALASTMAAPADGKTMDVASPRSRFLAVMKPKKCDIDPSICDSPGSGGPKCCGDQCVDLDSNALNCGKCGKVCKFTDACCAGKCVELSFNKDNCGRCSNQCKKGVLCYYGMCNYA